MVFFSLNVPGGSASVFLSLAEALQNKGYTVEIYTYYFDKIYCFPEITKKLTIFSVKEIRHNKKTVNNNSIFNRLQLGIDFYIRSKKLFELMDHRRYDIIYTSEAIAYLPGLLYKRKYTTPVLWSVFDPLSLADNKRPGLLIHKYNWFQYLLKLHNFFDTKILRKLDAIIVPTLQMKKQLDIFYSVNTKVIPTAGIRVINTKINYKQHARRRLPEYIKEKLNTHVVIYANGHFLPHRRYEDVLEAIYMLHEYGEKIVYIITGSSEFDPTYFNFLQEKIFELHLEDFVFLDDGYKTNEEIYGFYQLCTIFCFVSVEQTWGLAPFEAMQFGKPVIISDGVGCSEVLKDRENTLIVKSKDSKSIYRAILYITRNKHITEKLGKNGQRFVANNFTYEAIASKLIKYFKLFTTK